MHTGCSPETTAQVDRKMADKSHLVLVGSLTGLPSSNAPPHPHPPPYYISSHLPCPLIILPFTDSTCIFNRQRHLEWNHPIHQFSWSPMCTVWAKKACSQSRNQIGYWVDSILNHQEHVDSGVLLIEELYHFMEMQRLKNKFTFVLWVETKPVLSVKHAPSVSCSNIQTI